MPNISVIWSKTAANDLKSIIQYIHRENPHNAITIYTNIKAKANDLALFPERGRIVPELLEQGVGHYRELIIAPWRIIYRYSKEKVYVLAVIDSRRNVEDVLLHRLIR